MTNNLMENVESIPKVLLFFNLIVLIVSFFYVSKWLLITSSIINALFIGSYMLVRKYSHLFYGFIGLNRMGKVATKLDNALGGINKWAGS